MNDNFLLISVIIPVYNRTQELQRAIKSVLNQTYQSFEILVVDDGSTDDIKSVCEQLKDKRIRYLRNEKHTNANVARNRGIKEAKGEYIAMLDSDDEYLPHHLQRRIDKIKEWNCDGIFGSAYINDGEKENIELSRPLRNGEKMINYLLFDGFAPTPSHFYKTVAVKNIMWDDSLYRHQDFDFSIRFADKYTFKTDCSVTTIIHWGKDTKKNLFLDSCINFINKNKNDIDPRIYMKYHISMLSIIKQYDLSNNEEYYSLFEKRALEYSSYISFIDYFIIKTLKKKEKKHIIFIKFFLFQLKTGFKYLFL